MSAPSPIASPVEAALVRHGLRASRIAPLSGGSRRGVYRVELAAGGAIKARQLESAEAAETLVALRRGLESAFAPVIARHGEVVLEAWIEGRPLTERDAPARVQEAGALLGRLHARPLPAPVAVDVAEWRALAEAELAEPGTRDALAPEARAELALLLASAPAGRVDAASIHTDFCWDNMVIDAEGRLRVVDNEWQRVGPPGFDLGRTALLWEMSAPERARFLAAYRAAGAPLPAALAWWECVAALWTARLRRRRRGPDATRPLSLLRDHGARIASWRREEHSRAVGWNLSRLDGKRFVGELPWSYETLARSAMQRASRVLDVGTGGGELLASFRDSLPPRTCASEGWPRNFEIARARLAPLGIEVRLAREDRLPFEDASFDLVINRQAAVRADEVARVLTPGGRYLTQQIDAGSHTLRSAFGRPRGGDDGAPAARAQALERSGLEIEQTHAHTAEVVYADVATLVWHLVNMPWVVPDFSVERDLRHLLALQTRLELGDGLHFARTSLLLAAHKPGRRT